MNYVVLILGMAVITWVIRAAVFVLGDRLVFPPLVRTALGFVPVTVLTAIIVPMAVSPHGTSAELSLAQSATGRCAGRHRSQRPDAAAAPDHCGRPDSLFCLARRRA